MYIIGGVAGGRVGVSQSDQSDSDMILFFLQKLNSRVLFCNKSKILVVGGLSRIKVKKIKKWLLLHFTANAQKGKLQQVL